LDLSFELAGLSAGAEYVEAALTAMGRVVPAESIGRYDMSVADGAVALTSNPPEHAVDAVATAFARVAPEHPSILSCLARPEDQSPRRVSDLTPTRAWRQSRVFHELYAPLGVTFNLSFTTDPDFRSRLTGWSFSRTARDFTDGELTALAAVQPMMVVLDAVHRCESPLLRPRSTDAEEARVRLRITPRELEVLELLACGLTAQQMARLLRISTRTVGKHLERAYEKLGAHDRLSAVREAHLSGLIIFGAALQ
jgi:DNA-binding CsgD family transcriptional regulator